MGAAGAGVAQEFALGPRAVASISQPAGFLFSFSPSPFRRAKPALHSLEGEAMPRYELSGGADLWTPLDMTNHWVIAELSLWPSAFHPLGGALGMHAVGFPEHVSKRCVTALSCPPATETRVLTNGDWFQGPSQTNLVLNLLLEQTGSHFCLSNSDACLCPLSHIRGRREGLASTTLATCVHLQWGQGQARRHYLPVLPLASAPHPSQRRVVMWGALTHPLGSSLFGCIIVGH